MFALGSLLLRMVYRCDHCRFSPLGCTCSDLWHLSTLANKQVSTDLTWLAGRLKASGGLSLIRGDSWDILLADVVVIRNACSSGVGF